MNKTTNQNNKNDLLETHIREYFLKRYFVYNFSKIDYLTSVFIFIISCIFYIQYLTPSVSAGDNGELTTAMHFLGIAHAPTYPIHSIFGKIFTFLPFHTVGWRANFFSSFCAAITLTFSFLVYLRLLTACGTKYQIARIIAFLTTITFMMSNTLWSQSIMCEVYTVSSIFYPIGLLILLKWIDQIIKHQNDFLPYLGEPYLLAYSLLFGVGMAGHSTIVLTGGLGFFIIFTFLYIFVFSKRELNQSQKTRGLLYTGILVSCVAIAYGAYYYYIMSFSSNVMANNAANTKTGTIIFILLNLVLLTIYIYDRYLATDRLDVKNYLTRSFYMATKMFFYFLFRL